MNADTQNNSNMPPENSGAHIIVFGNEKGGSGKSTTAMHVAIALLRLGYKVGTIDLDARQGTITRYMSHRWQHAASSSHEIPMPTHMAIDKSAAATTQEQEQQDSEFLFMAMDELSCNHDFIVVDTPGTYSYLSRLAHSQADTLITPMNDSFIDLDLLAHFDQESGELLRYAPYAKMVKEHLKQNTHWIVMRNRLSHLQDNNKLEVGSYLEKLKEELGFTLLSGFSERVIFKELFLHGLTLLDLKSERTKPLTMSEISARQEVRQLIHTIAPENIKGYALKKKTDAI